VPGSDLEALQAVIYDVTASHLAPHDKSLPVSLKIQVPFVGPAPAELFSKLMRTVNESPELDKIIKHPGVTGAFAKVFGEEPIEFPISRFRAQFPANTRSVYNWHQDEGTWYAVPVKTLAHLMPATLWLSLNGADSSNSIEIISGSHRLPLQNHFFTEGQGYFTAIPPKETSSMPRLVVKAEPGDGICFHPLTFHRSIEISSLRPRYSIDVRYYSPEGAKESYKVSWKFLAKRLLAR
jgi:hypothetical protein